MIRLTAQEREILAGREGPFRQKALEFIVRYAEVLGAEELCRISRATLFIGAQHYLDVYPQDEDYRKIFSQFYLNSEEILDFGTVDPGCKAQTCAGCCEWDGLEGAHGDPQRYQRNQIYMEAAKKMGISIVDSCTPYYEGWIPMMGEHFVSTESSNVVLSNSLFGGYGTSDGVEAAVCAAISGRIPRWGMHIPENRFGTCVVHVQARIETQCDWDLLGYTLGRMMPKGSIPVVVGAGETLEINGMRQFCAAVSVLSNTELCHIVGYTPEARTLEMALGGKTPAYEITIGEADIQQSRDMLCDAGEGPVGLVFLGCPHVALDELKEFACYLQGKHVAPGSELQIWTDCGTKEKAKRSGYLSTIEQAGGNVLVGSCPVVMGKESISHAKSLVMYGAKQAHTIRHQAQVPVYYGSPEECLEAAVTGVWKTKK